MAIALDTAACNNLLDNGAKAAYSTASVAIKDAGANTLATITLPTFGAAASGSLTLPSQPSGVGTAAAGAGTAATNYVVTLTGGGTETGTVTATGGGGDMTLDDVNIVENGVVTITTFSITQPGS
jgi:hypothetical protein